MTHRACLPYIRNALEVREERREAAEVRGCLVDLKEQSRSRSMTARSNVKPLPWTLTVTPWHVDARQSAAGRQSESMAESPSDPGVTACLPTVLFPVYHGGPFLLFLQNGTQFRLLVIHLVRGVFGDVA
jgi:hypothetical protein